MHRPFGRAVLPPVEALCQLVTKTIQEMKADGSLKAIYEKWFGEDYSQPPAGYVSPWQLQ